MNVLLVIAQNQSVCESLRASLASNDMVLFEPNLEGAMRRLVGLRVDLILLDDAPGLGVESMPSLKQAAPGAPVVVFSSRGDLVSQAALHRAGADAVVVKPFSCEVLSQTLAKLIEDCAVDMPRREQPQTPPFDDGRLHQHQMALRWLSRTSIYADDIHRLAQSMMEAAMDIFGAVRSAVLLETVDGVRVLAGQGISKTVCETLCLQYDSGMMRAFDENACLIVRDRLATSPMAMKELRLLQGRIAAPLLRHGRVFGALVLGDKAAAQDYSSEECDLVVLLARSASGLFERGTLEQEQQHSTESLAQTLHTVPVGIVVVDIDKKVRSVNPQAEQLLRLRAGDFVGRSVQKLGSSFADAVIRALKHQDYGRGVRFLEPAAATTLEMNLAPAHEGGVCVAFYRAGEVQVNREDVLYSPFWEFLSGRVAQEVKNPMVAINTFAQLLPRKFESEDFRESFSRVVQEEVARINQVVETLFDFSKNPKLALERCNLTGTIENVLESFEEELQRRTIELRTDWDPKATEAQIDPVFFSQALHNILQNSLDAMPQGGQLMIETKQVDGNTEIYVKDSGPGISEEASSQIFMPFFSTKERGMGLGLATANRIMDLHKGEIKLVENEEGGSCFALSLPNGEKNDDQGRSAD